MVINEHFIVQISNKIVRRIFGIRSRWRENEHLSPFSASAPSKSTCLGPLPSALWYLRVIDGRFVGLIVGIHSLRLRASLDRRVPEPESRDLPPLSAVRD